MMKRCALLLTALLCLAGQEWMPHELSIFNYKDNGETIYRLHHIIGTYREEWSYDHAIPYCDKLYTVLADNVIWMTQAEMEKANAALNAVRVPRRVPLVKEDKLTR